MKEIIVRYQDMPCVIKAYVREDPEGDFNIYINSKLSIEAQEAALQHELKHIRHDDFHNTLPIAGVEGLAL